LFYCYSSFFISYFLFIPLFLISFSSLYFFFPFLSFIPYFLFFPLFLISFSFLYFLFQTLSADSGRFNLALSVEAAKVAVMISNGRILR